MQPAAATLLNLPPISSLPPRSLSSEADYLCLRAGDTPAPCNVRNARAICEDEGGCKAKDKPGCLFKVKEIWSSAGFPMKERDDHIMRVLNKITKKHADKKKAFSSARLKEEDRAKFVEQIKNTTVNLAPCDYKSKIMAIMALPAHLKRHMIAVMDDYLGKEGSR